jgi:hypothetical protein
MARLPIAASFLGSLLVAGCKVPIPEPDARWDVTVSGDATNCRTDKDATAYENSYTYEVTWPNRDEGDVTTTEIRIDGEPFATGQTSGCTIEYASPTWLDEREQGYIKWNLVGNALEQQAAGGCEIAKEFDWDGTETITVEESTDTSIEEGCTYTLIVQGHFLGAGG